MDGRGSEGGEGHRSGLPGVARREDTDRIVCHVDMDCFYASCERRRESRLRGEPVVIGMGYEPGTDDGAVATASYEARDAGVESAQAISVALDRLPNREETDFDDPDVAVSPAETGFYRSVDMAHYQSVSEGVRRILHEAADTVREVSIDEAYLDVTERTAWAATSETNDGGSTRPDGSDNGDSDEDSSDSTDGSGDRSDRNDQSEGSNERTLAAAFAHDLAVRIEREVGVPASVGVAPNMSAAKVASDAEKPEGVVVVPPGEVRDFLAPLSIEAVHGVGPVRARALREMGVETAGDLAAADPRDLVDRFGERGRDLYDRARGNDDRPVTPKGEPKSLNRESAFAEATSDVERHRAAVADLAGEVAARAAEEGALYRTIGIKVVTPPFDVNTRARSLSGPVANAELVEQVALELLGEFEEATIRKVGVRVSNLEFATADQSSLGNWAGTGGADGTDAADGSDVDRAADRPGHAGQASLTDFDR